MKVSCAQEGYKLLPTAEGALPKSITHRPFQYTRHDDDDCNAEPSGRLAFLHLQFPQMDHHRQIGLDSKVIEAIAD
jgi:hypothetical protein